MAVQSDPPGAPLATTPSHNFLRGRLDALDGLRGLAALVVFAHHALVLLYGPLAGIDSGHLGRRPAAFYRALHTFPLAWMFNGTFAVSFFFVLSGLVLTRAMGPAPTPARVGNLLAARFLRLLPLVLLGTLLGFVAFDTAVRHIDLLTPFTGNGRADFIGAELLARHNLGVALKQGGWLIWRGVRAETLLDPPLWSIGVELKGSLLVYLLAGAFAQTPNVRAKYVFGLAAGLIFVGPDSISFLAGMLLAERYGRWGQLLPLGRGGLLLGSALALCWASVHPWDRALWLPLPLHPPELVDTLLSTACAAVLMAAGLQLATLRTILQSGCVQFFGRASYGLYVLHVPIFYLGAGPCVVALAPRCGYHAAAAITCLLLAATSLVLGDQLIRRVDAPLAARSKAWATAFLQRPSSPV